VSGQPDVVAVAAVEETAVEDHAVLTHLYLINIISR
jgi:hypothetical protein